MRPALSHRVEDGVRLGSLLWEFEPGWRMISSAMLGGGIGPRRWVLNAQVAGGYSRMDPVAHLTELGPSGPSGHTRASADTGPDAPAVAGAGTPAGTGLGTGLGTASDTAADTALDTVAGVWAGAGVGMMTAAQVDRYVMADDGGVRVTATVGLRVPTWAAAPEGGVDPELAPERLATAPGTINIMVAVPVAMTDAALVNAVMTVTEAKSQALIEAGFPCTGTASDAVCVAVHGHGPAELFGGPRSTWGARVARAVHQAVRRGADDWLAYAASRGYDPHHLRP
ncbi:adenosylcobinamide amidohydrolase [Streptosporangium sp. KLBMP 9127]|nr:adenosylcobinamide amidohydrolase [Streptosporangium sp. KLBMP 9127]